ncbi:nucleotidyltransferase family protein [Campylobacter pinnipediorum]|uniref:nucleotidyltransferase family protein n=1 Tax=Campylobacter pinnipediorum TaxID=1965231 RepID=UPI00084CF778|nr:nucleotidyltransferase domain-containing protein [Campylobacter pinnipediorum]AQW83685.1 nucleotidyl transferase domain protein [Campylobacter pinnipediorum subsp. pinnipediorum]
MSVLTKEEILRYLAQIKPQLQEDGIKEIGLFGSYAKGYADENSDIDIVIFADKIGFLDRLDVYGILEYLEKLKAKISAKFHKSVDICDYYNKERLYNNKITKGAIFV